MSFPLARMGSDHIPIHIKIGTDIPKASLFRFDNCWLEFEGFNEVISECWNSAPYKSVAALMINSRLKNARHGLKKWSRDLSNLNKIIDNCSFIRSLLDGIEEQRELSIIEKNFKTILMEHTRKLLEAKRIY